MRHKSYLEEKALYDQVSSGNVTHPQKFTMSIIMHTVLSSEYKFV